MDQSSSCNDRSDVEEIDETLNSREEGDDSSNCEEEDKNREEEDSEECEEEADIEDTMSESDYLRKLSACLLPIDEGEDDYIEKKVLISNKNCGGENSISVYGEEEEDEDDEVSDEDSEQNGSDDSRGEEEKEDEKERNLCSEDESVGSGSESKSSDNCSSSSERRSKNNKKSPRHRVAEAPSRRKPPKGSNPSKDKSNKKEAKAGDCTPVRMQTICKEGEEREDEGGKRPCKRVIIPPNVNKARIKVGSLVIDVDDTLKDKFETNVYAKNVGDKDLHVKATVSADCYKIDVDSLREKSNSKQEKQSRCAAGMAVKPTHVCTQSLGNIQVEEISQEKLLACRKRLESLKVLSKSIEGTCKKLESGSRKQVSCSTLALFPDV